MYGNLVHYTMLYYIITYNALISNIEQKLLNERNRRTKPFFDRKVQTDLNCFWLYANLYASLVLKDENLFEDTIKSINELIDKLKNKIFHCYESTENDIDVFLDDFVYLSLLLITMF